MTQKKRKNSVYHFYILNDASHDTKYQKYQTTSNQFCTLLSDTNWNTAATAAAKSGAHIYDIVAVHIKNTGRYERTYSTAHSSRVGSWRKR